MSLRIVVDMNLSVEWIPLLGLRPSLTNLGHLAGRSPSIRSGSDATKSRISSRTRR